jgi:hypothetical protein
LSFAAFAAFAFAGFSKWHRFFFWFCSHGVVLLGVGLSRLSCGISRGLAGICTFPEKE